MVKPRYDSEGNLSRHGATSESCCYQMQQKYGWKLIDIEPLETEILKVDCVFEGRTEFPKSYYDPEEEE